MNHIESSDIPPTGHHYQDESQTAPAFDGDQAANVGEQCPLERLMTLIEIHTLIKNIPPGCINQPGCSHSFGGYRE